jgi:hypothetical protein
MRNTDQYLKDNLYFRCGHAVSRLCEAGLVERPQLSSSENEVHEWWLVSADLAQRLQQVGLPVLTFYELHMWGRASPRGNVAEDLDLLGALHAKQARAS